MTPQPWSHSRLSTFKNCPRQFVELHVHKSVKETESEQVIWGQEVHKHFEKRIADGTPLPVDLESHEPYMTWLSGFPGNLHTEDKIALSRSMQPCGFFDKDVWYRGVIDFMSVKAPYARIVDYKTGKRKNDFGQLKLFAIHTFARFPDVHEIRADYYWTQLRSVNGETYTRDQIPQLWQEFLPDLRQYAEAFKTDTWQPRQSGLCRGWCPVTDCEFWEEKRMRG